MKIQCMLKELDTVYSVTKDQNRKVTKEDIDKDTGLFYQRLICEYTHCCMLNNKSKHGLKLVVSS